MNTVHVSGGKWGDYFTGHCYKRERDTFFKVMEDKFDGHRPLCMNSSFERRVGNTQQDGEDFNHHVLFLHASSAIHSVHSLRRPL